MDSDCMGLHLRVLSQDSRAGEYLDARTHLWRICIHDLYILALEAFPTALALPSIVLAEARKSPPKPDQDVQSLVTGESW
ncbi:hypothetical protein PM082_015435 [Marasmius tenuissimus]|nr:hypothetical protein PM082_015435 [Marasmius tenuissimus]